jgi:glucosamine-6-phosphate deaminase
MDDREGDGLGTPLITVEPAVTAMAGWPGSLLVAKDGAALAEGVAEILAESLIAEPQRTLGLATGRTMDPVYAALVRRLVALPPAQLEAIRADWRSFNLDEYVGLSPADPRSFAATMARQLGEPLGLDPGRLHLPMGLAADPDHEAIRYNKAIEAAGGIDLLLLGLGNNGHVGFNEPPCLPSAVSRCVVLSPGTRRQNSGLFGGDPAAVPGAAITLGLVEILQARRILLVVGGSGKAPILRRLLTEPASSALPASWLRGHPALQVWVDRAALSG